MSGESRVPGPTAPGSCRHLVVGSMALVLVAGCTLSPERPSRGDAHHPKPGGGQVIRERTLQDEWRGKTYGSLVEVIGAPRLKLSIPGRDPRLTWAVYYGIRDSLADCFDAFTIVVIDGEERIADYFCR